MRQGVTQATNSRKRDAANKPAAHLPECSEPVREMDAVAATTGEPSGGYRENGYLLLTSVPLC